MPNLVLALACAGVLLTSYIGVASWFYDRGYTARDAEVAKVTAERNEAISSNNAKAGAEMPVADANRQEAVRAVLAAVPDDPPEPTAKLAEAAPASKNKASRPACPCSGLPASAIDQLNRIR